MLMQSASTKQNCFAVFRLPCFSKVSFLCITYFLFGVHADTNTQPQTIQQYTPHFRWQQGRLASYGLCGLNFLLKTELRSCMCVFLSMCVVYSVCWLYVKTLSSSALCWSENQSMHTQATALKGPLVPIEHVEGKYYVHITPTGISLFAIYIQYIYMHTRPYVYTRVYIQL